MRVNFEKFLRKMYARDVLFEIWVPRCRARVHQGKNKGADVVARSSIWTSIGFGFWSFSLPGVFSRVVFSQCATRKVLSVFV